MTQTVTQWLIEEIHKNMGVWIPPHIQDQAKQMEKEQIMDAYAAGSNDRLRNRINEQYYKETYAGKDL